MPSLTHAKSSELYNKESTCLAASGDAPCAKKKKYLHVRCTKIWYLPNNNITRKTGTCESQKIYINDWLSRNVQKMVFSTTEIMQFNDNGTRSNGRKKRKKHFLVIITVGFLILFPLQQCWCRCWNCFISQVIQLLRSCCFFFLTFARRTGHA